MIRSICAVLVFAMVASASAQSVDDVEHHIVYEIGWAGDWSHDEGLHPKGGTFAFEVPINERWLEIEFGIEVTIHVEVVAQRCIRIHERPSSAASPASFVRRSLSASCPGKRCGHSSSLSPWSRQRLAFLFFGVSHQIASLDASQSRQSLTRSYDRNGDL